MKEAFALLNLPVQLERVDFCHQGPGEQLVLNSSTATVLGQATHKTVTNVLESQQHFSVIFFINDCIYSSYTISKAFLKRVFMTDFIPSQQTYQFLLYYLLKHYRL